MTMHWLGLIGIWMTSRIGAMCVLLPMATAAVAMLDDWYRRTRQMRRGASIEALEALFALTDPRVGRRR